MNKYLVTRPIEVTNEVTIPSNVVIEMDGLKLAWLDKEEIPILTFEFSENQFDDVLDKYILIPMQ